MSMLSDFMSENGISPETLVGSSQKAEASSNADRLLRVARETARRNKKSYVEEKIDKPSTLGRGLSLGLAQRAMAGAPVSRIVRKKIVRAVNAQLLSAKKDAIDWRALFADVPVKKAKKKS